MTLVNEVLKCSVQRFQLCNLHSDTFQVFLGQIFDICTGPVTIIIKGKQGPTILYGKPK